VTPSAGGHFHPGVPDFHLVASESSRLLFVTDGSRIFDVPSDLFAELEGIVHAGDGAAARAMLTGLELSDAAPFVQPPPIGPPLKSLSLAVAQACNLGCTYCYAQGGDFGGIATTMPIDVARQSIDLLFRESIDGPVTLVFLGGEPLANRPVLRAATEYAHALSVESGRPCGFSITTNATLVTGEDADFFARHRFAVTVSIDGTSEVHNLQRPFRDGRPSYDRVMSAVALLRARPELSLGARVTVTPNRFPLADALDELVQHGFQSVGFSPTLRSPTGRGEMNTVDLAAFLDQMIDCAVDFERAIVAGRDHAFANARNALLELHRGAHRPYPCGAGSTYMGVSASGNLHACHRFVGDDEARFGSVTEGLDRPRQQQWIELRHVDSQEPCDECWARYLCGGGCHHEVIGRGRHACDYVRGWLHHCLGMYARIGKARPEFLDSLAHRS
jgi:uncharacterized protein